MGYLVAIISGGRGACLEMRFRMLGVSALHVNCARKTEKLQEFMAEHGLQPDQVMFMGDDIPDIEAMTQIGLPVCPADAVPEVIEISRYVSQFPGGKGCVRDVVEQTLRAQGHWALNSEGVNTIPSA